MASKDKLRHRNNADDGPVDEDMGNVLASTQIALVSVDADLRIRWFTPAAEMLLNLSVGDVGLPLGDLTLTFDIGDIDAKLLDAMQSIAVPDLEVRDRRGRWYSMRIRPYRTASGKIDGAVLIFLNIDLQKQGEASLREAAEAQQLQEQRKDEFLSILAHELRNPLAAIRSSLYLSENPRISPDDARHARDVMKRQVAHMVRLIDDLLDVARIAKGRIEFRPEPIDLAKVIESALESARSSLDCAAQTLEVIMPRMPTLLYADPVRLAQAISNILLNACRYTPDRGHIKLSVDIVHDRCLISVLDNGIGIDPAQQGIIFEMFAQADHVPGRVRDGLGIGLSMVKALVEMHDGQVTVESAGRGHGSKFTISLPMRRRDDHRRRTGDTRQRLPAGQRILVVDDDRDAADSIARVLQLEGHQVSTAYGSDSGFELAAATLPHIALLDLGMPGLDGHALCRKLRATPWGAKILAVALTGWGQDVDKRASMDAGFDAHLIKPVDPEQLTTELQAIANRKAEHAHGTD